jgi:hypothetical protein
MKTKRFVALWSIAALLLLICACAPAARPVLEAGDSEVKLRSIQSRVFDTPD